MERTEDFTAPRERVPLIDAMLLWNPRSDDARIIRIQDFDDRFRDIYEMRELAYEDENEFLYHLILGAWIAVLRDGVEPATIHRALCSVPEYVLACPNDMPDIAALTGARACVISKPVRPGRKVILVRPVSKQAWGKPAARG